MTAQGTQDGIDWQDISEIEENWRRYVASIGPFHIETWETAKQDYFAVMITLNGPDGAIIAEHKGLNYHSVDAWVLARLRDERRRRAQRLGKAQAKGMARTLDMFTRKGGARSYWLLEKAIRCGAYPGDRDPAVAHTRLVELIGLGVTCFIDLTESRELEAYWPQLMTIAKERGIDIQYVRHAIIDVQTPTVREMRAILDTIDAARACGRVVYVHCRGGVGRTGTVAGAYLVRHGLAPRAALKMINDARRGMYNDYKLSPETSRQENMVWDWKRGD